MYKILAFEAGARFALFRRTYANVTSLSYRFPPRNTVIGMLGAVLGRERDSYYQEFSKDRCRAAVQILSKPRTVRVATNYIDTDRGPVMSSFERPRQQIQVEYLTSEEGFLRYRIFVDYPELINELHRRMSTRELMVPVSLGPAHCLGYIDNAVLLDCTIEGKKEANSVTVVPAREWQPIPRRNAGVRIMVEEALPPNFGPRREPLQGTGGNYFFEANGKPIFVKSADNTERAVFTIRGEDGAEVEGVFL